MRISDWSSDVCSSDLNCGKRSVALNLKQPESLSVVRRLVAELDVVVENFRPGVMARLGLDYGNLAKINPRLVYCSISGFGQTGAAARHAAYAPVSAAASARQQSIVYGKQVVEQ